MTCSLCALYPVLARVPADERPALVAQAERGEPLTAGQVNALGLSALLVGVVLLPARAGQCSPQQMSLTFPGGKHDLAEV